MRKEAIIAATGLLALTVGVCGAGTVIVDAKLGQIKNLTPHFLEIGKETQLDFDSSIQGHCHLGTHRGNWVPHLFCRGGTQFP